MIQNPHPAEQLVQGNSERLSPPQDPMRIASRSGPSTDMDDTTATELDIDCRDAAGNRVPFADAVHAVFDGTADPDDFTTTLRPVRAPHPR